MNPNDKEKDALISAMRKELHDLHSLDHRFLAVNDQITKAETQYEMLQDDIERVDAEHRIKVDLNRKTIAELRNDIDSIKIQIHKGNVAIEDISRENGGLKRACENRQSEIAMLMANNQELEKKNLVQAEQNKARVQQIKKIKEDRNKADQDLEKLEKQLDLSMRELKQLQKRARIMDSENSRLQSVLVVAERDHSDLLNEIKSRDQVVSDTNQRLDQLESQISALKAKLNQIQLDCKASELESRNISLQLQAVSARNKELVKALKAAEQANRQAENDYDRMVIERENLSNQHVDLANTNKLLNAQIDRCLLDIMEYERINSDLQRQVQHYVQCDQEARARLNRRDTLNKMLLTVTEQLQKTSQPISHLRSSNVR